MSYDFNKKSTFTGKTIGFIGIYFLVVLLSSLTMGIGAPWASCMLIRWLVTHSVIDGKHFEFRGTGGRLWGKMILWALIPVIVFGLGMAAIYFFPNETVKLLVSIVWCFFLCFYVFWVMVQEIKWYVKNIHIVDAKESKENEMSEDDAEYFSEM